MAEIDFIGPVHRATSRNYLERVAEHDKAACAEKALGWGRDYWDGDRSTGYGGFHYDGRWRPVAEAIVAHYQLPGDARILDVGCGKGFLLYEFTQVLPRSLVYGLDISAYAIEHAKPEVRSRLQVGNAASLPFDDSSFDLVVSINTLHNLYNYELWPALREIERVGRRERYITVESYRNEREKVNLLYWQLTCRAFHSVAEWRWLFEQTGYSGDHGFIFFE
jgi:ubiquinone/menaquinone biosynthesis C-methylase UbiE